MPGLDERFDPYFASLGLEGRPFALRGRQYEGAWHGRTLSVDMSRRSRTRYAGEIRYRRYHGHRLNVNLSTSRQTRLIIFPPALGMRLFAQTNRFFGLKQLTNRPAALAHLEVWAADLPWAENFLADTAVQAQLSRLFPPDDLPPNVALNLRPGSWLYSLRASLADLQPPQLDAWLAALLALAELAEAAPDPLVVSRPNWLEIQSRERPWLVGCGFIGLIVGLVLLCSFCFVALLLLVSFAAAGG